MINNNDFLNLTSLKIATNWKFILTTMIRSICSPFAQKFTYFQVNSLFIIILQNVQIHNRNNNKITLFSSHKY